MAYISGRRYMWQMWSNGGFHRGQKVCQTYMSQRQRLLISLWEKIIGKPYWGKPDVRFDEGGVETDLGGEPAACDS